MPIEGEVVGAEDLLFQIGVQNRIEKALDLRVSEGLVDQPRVVPNAQSLPKSRFHSASYLLSRLSDKSSSTSAS